MSGRFKSAGGGGDIFEWGMGRGTGYFCAGTGRGTGYFCAGTGRGGTFFENIYTIKVSLRL